VRPPDALRVAVLGSSVTYGMAMGFADTIPAVVERELRAGGHHAEVLNFGTHAFTIVNLSAQLQAYVHQFEPDVAVAVVDLQVGFPDWPAVRPAAASPDEGPQGLGRWRALLRRGSERSALVALFDEPRRARRWVRRVTGLPLRPRSGLAPDRQPEPRSPLPAGPAPAAPDRPTPSPPPDVRAYEERRERELAAPIAAMAAFCAERSIALYFVTPYGPYFDFTDDELAGMSVQGFLEESARVHGSERAALVAEVELITRVVRRVAARGAAHVVDMLEASRGSSLRTSPDFTPDGVHLSPAGNAALGRLVAARIARDVKGRAGDGD
ncbi:MAG TPA: SGNH/GDSL hydrolase family protein, partial [Vicinamibacteria bacterium]